MQSNIRVIKDFHAAAKREDPTFAYGGWKKGTQVPIICHADDFPDDFDEFRKHYTDGLRTKSKGVIWFKMRVGWSSPISGLTSTSTSVLSYWFQDNQAGAFLTAVQDSDDVRTLGDFLYSGGFMDPNHLTQLLKDAWKKAYPTQPELMAGCRTKLCKQIKIADKKANSWVMAANQPISIEVDRTQATKLKLLLYQLFNKKRLAKDRPEAYNLLFLPSEDQMMTGSAGDRERKRALRKHKLVVQSLTLVKASLEEVVLSLDAPFVKNNQTYTLRAIVLELPYPLDFTQETPSRLFNSVDFASKGDDLKYGFVYYTTHKSYIDTAKGAVAALPAYIRHILGDEAVKTWFASPEIGRDIDLGVTPEGYWDGTWSTKEDQVLCDILDADCGFHIDNLQLVDQDQEDEDENARRVLLNADDASHQSFGTALFGRAGPPGKGGVAHTLPQNGGSGSEPPTAVAAAPEAMSGGDAA